MSMAEHGDYWGECEEAITIKITTADREWTLTGSADECPGARISYALDLLKNLGFTEVSYAVCEQS